MPVELRPVIRSDVAGCVLLGALWMSGVFGCGQDPRRTSIDDQDPESFYAPGVVDATDRLSHDDARCFRGWIDRSTRVFDGESISPEPKASTIGEAAEQARVHDWCLFEPAPDIGKQLYECIDLARSPTESFGCHCHLVVPHLQYLAAAEGRRKHFDGLTHAQLDACVHDQAKSALCSISAGSLDQAERCLAQGGW